VFADGARQGEERFQAGPGGFRAEPVEQYAGLFDIEVAGEDRAEGLLERVRAPERAAVAA
jgi:hypothetical protein